MKYSLLTLVLINLALAGVTAGVYFWHINLWFAQGIVFFTALGASVNGLSFLGFTISLLMNRTQKWFKKFILAVLFLTLFSAHLGVLGFIFWQRYFNV